MTSLINAPYLNKFFHEPKLLRQFFVVFGRGLKSLNRHLNVVQVEVNVHQSLHVGSLLDQILLLKNKIDLFVTAHQAIVRHSEKYSNHLNTKHLNTTVWVSGIQIES